MSRNRSDKIIKYRCCYDPEKAEKVVKRAKIRPFIEKRNEQFMKHRPTEKKSNVDESMVPYFGSYGASIKWLCIKILFVLATRCGALTLPLFIYLFFYQGTNGQNTNYKDIFGVGRGIFFSLIYHFSEHVPLHLFLEKFFTFVLLLEELSQRNIFVTGTFDKDRVGDCPLSAMKLARKDEHEVHNAVDSSEKPLVILRWQGNGEITIFSNCIGVDPVGNVRRWNKTERKIVDIPALAMVLQYNSSMGETDVMVHDFSCNPPGIRSKWWWLPLLPFCLQSSLYNSYLTYPKTPGTTQLILTSFVLL